MTSERIAWLNQPTRRAILDTAEEHFARLGYDSARVDAIASDARVSKSHLYYHFPTKADLLAALVELRTAELLDIKDQVATTAGKGDGAVTVQALTKVLNRMFRKVLIPRRRFARVLLMEMLKGSDAMEPAVAALGALAHDTVARFRAMGCGIEGNHASAMWLHFGLVPALFAVAVPRPLVDGVDPLALVPELARWEARVLSKKEKRS